MRKQFVTNLDEEVIKNLKRIALELNTSVNVLIEATYHYVVHHPKGDYKLSDYQVMIDYCKSKGYIE